MNTELLKAAEAEAEKRYPYADTVPLSRERQHHFVAGVEWTLSHLQPKLETVGTKKTTEFTEGNYWVKYAGEWKVGYCIPKSWTNGYWLLHGIKAYYHTSDFEEIGERIEHAEPLSIVAQESDAVGFAEFGRGLRTQETNGAI